MDIIYEGLFNKRTPITIYYRIFNDVYKNDIPKVGDIVNNAPIYSRYKNYNGSDIKYDNPKCVVEDLFLRSQYDEDFREYRITNSEAKRKITIYKVEGNLSYDKYSGKPGRNLSSAKIVSIEYSGTIEKALSKYNIKYSIKSNRVNSKALESFLIPEDSIATEDLFDGIMNVTNFILTPLYKIRDYNENKDKIAEAKLRDEQRKKQLQEEINNLVTLNKRYHFLDSESNYNKHIKNAHAFADKKIRQYVNLANKDAKAFAELRSKVLKAYGDDVASEPLFKSLKPGYFTCQDEWDYWIIIPDQDIALCCELHWNIAEKLNTLNDMNLTFVSFSNGDGDEGCVYFNYLPYNIVFERYPGLKTALKESN